MEAHVHGDPLRKIRSEKGRINIVTILIIVVLAAGIYLVAMLAPAYIEHYKFEEKLRAVANSAHRVKDEERLRQEIDGELKILGMELPYDAVKITFDSIGEWVEFSASYAKVVKLVPFGAKVTLHFDSLIVERFD
jgi:hypothetical protein